MSTYGFIDIFLTNPWYNGIMKIYTMDATKKKILTKLEKIYGFFQIMNASEVMTPALAIKKTDAMLKQASELTQLYIKNTK